MRDPIADLKHELLVAADRQHQQDSAVGAGRRRLHVSLSRNRVVLTAVTVAVVAAATLLFTTPWSTSPGFLARAQAALTPPAGTVLHMKLNVTSTTPAFSCTVTRGPYEAWIDQTAPHKFRMLLNDSPLPKNPAELEPLELARELACSSGTPSEVGGTLDTQEFLEFEPPNVLWHKPPALNLPVDFAAWLRERISAGSAHDEGKTELDGLTVERIRLDGTQVDCPVPGCELDPVKVYVDPETFHPVQIESPHGYINPPGGRIVRFDTVTRYLTFEYLPQTDDNLALTDIRAQHPDAIER